MKFKLFVKKVMSATLVTTMLFAISCHEKENVSPTIDHGKFRIEPLTDAKIKAEILAMASGRPIKAGRTTIAPPVTLPAGYDYNNAVQITISGTNWVTYVAFSNTINDEFSKEMVGIFYQNGVYKNYTKNRWDFIDHPQGAKFIVTHRMPENSTNYFKATFIPSSLTGAHPINRIKIYPPSQCGQATMDCIDDFYTGNGWLSVGLSILTAFQPEMIIAVSGGCMVGCALLGP